MSETKQNPRYHAEGSVLAHTRLVLEQYQLLSPSLDLSPADHEVFYWASVLHDIGKVKVTQWQDDRWRSQGHERAGVPMALDILVQQPQISGAQRRRILDLVRWHGFPLDYYRQQAPIDKLKLLGSRTDLRMLAIFSLFDFQGRICEDRDTVLHLMHQFQHHDVPKAEYEFARFADLQAKFEGMNLRHKNALWTAVHNGQAGFAEKLMEAREIEDVVTRGKKVFITIGAPLSGKTTWLQANMPDTFRISMAEHGLAEEDLGDSFYADRKLVEFKHFLVVYTNRHKHVVLDGCNLDLGFRLRMAEMIRACDLELEYLVFEESLETIKERNAKLEFPSTDERLETLYAKQDLVHPWEAHAVRFVS